MLQQRPMPTNDCSKVNFDLRYLRHSSFSFATPVITQAHWTIGKLADVGGNPHQYLRNKVEQD